MTKIKPVIGLIGFGIVGKSVHHAFKDLCDFRIHDTNKNISQNTLLETVTDSDFIFICVPTPMKEDGSFDSSIIDSVVDSVAKYIEGTDKILIIKSTVVPSTTQGYIDKYPKCNIINCPEFLREKHYLEDAGNPSRIIFGVPSKWLESHSEREDEINKELFIRLFHLYKKRFPDKEIYVCNPTVAEMTKYVCNCFLATKVSFFNEIYDICQELDIDYDAVIKLVLTDERIGKSHYKVPNDGDRGFGKKCFPKDLNALIKKAIELGVSPLMMMAAWMKNIEVREKREWEKK